MENEKKSRFKSVCVFCGSSSGKRDVYGDAAIELAQQLVEKRLDLVYGGGSIGLMGLISQAVHCGGGHKTGESIGEVKAVGDMHERKAEMARHSDCFIALPAAGGYGTLEELLEVITWAQLGIHDKPVGLLNVDGYYNYLLTFIDKAVDDGFIKPSQRHIFVSAPNAKELIHKLEMSFDLKLRFTMDISFASMREWGTGIPEANPIIDEIFITIAETKWPSGSGAAAAASWFNALQAEVAL
ncbi:hypothetical protein CTI12_AA234670 [Artemisia annua]|uniref:Cytokinin riboside 5'-monophosphate phosphoribohydrolase n=1 Tax=Artemisia annua TaxID=35608 RepID=A0A2U1NT05_ARTAN|nr:hypothetical protein CTI12_AA234670 [Artemisia annua]